MITYKNKFPRIDQEDNNPDFRKIFPWGCDQLTDDTNLTVGYYKIICLTSLYKIFIAYKYGIWSFSSQKRYFAFYLFYEATKHKPFYYVFLYNNIFMGIARVVDFCPEQSFKYWEI
jgi:hypothetical protein